MDGTDATANNETRGLNSYGAVWTLDEAGKTVVRGGTGVLFSSIMLALIQDDVADPFIGAATNYNRTDLVARGLKWPDYAEEI